MFRIIAAVPFSTVALALGALLAAPPLAGAAVIDVTTTGDPGPGGTTSLRQAVALAAAGGTINLPAGTYTLAGGAITLTKSLTIQGAGAGVTTINGANASRIFTLTAAGPTEIAGLTITGGRTGTPGGIGSGGAIQADGASPLTLRQVALIGNTVDTSGTSGGGGLAQGGAVSTSSNLTLLETVVRGNHALARGGAAMSGGGSAKGGGIMADGGAATALHITDSALDENTVDATGATQGGGGTAQGGGIYSTAAGVTLTRSAVTRSSVVARAVAGGGGGGIAGGAGIFTNGAPDLANATLSGNVADAGAAGAGTGGTAVGGGIWTTKGLTAVHVTVAANSAVAVGANVGAQLGGNIALGNGATSIANSIVAGGTSGPGKENCSELLTSAGHNIESSNQCGFSAAGDRTGTDPQLGALQDNGGRSLTHAITSASPAFDAAGGACPATDQRGLPRPQVAGCDIGAFEYQPPPPAPAPAAPAPLAPAPAKPLPALFGAKGVVSGFPSTKRCLSRRAFTIRIRRLAGVTIAKATVSVNGRQVAVRSGKRLTAPVNLTKLPKGRYTVKIVVRLADGRTVTGTRRYRTCTPKRRSTAKPKV